MIPAIIVLLLFLALVVVELGGLLAETLTERRKMKVNVPELVDAFQRKDAGEIMEEISNSRLFRRQKTALVKLIKHSNLPAASLQAVACRLLAGEELHYARITNRTDVWGPCSG
jgi:hypothetical protein